MELKHSRSHQRLLRKNRIRYEKHNKQVQNPLRGSAARLYLIEGR